MSEYTLDTGAAKKAENLFSKIEEKGKYTGIFTRAEKTVSKKGSKGVDFSFKSNSGSTADYLSIWTHNGEGKQLQGFNTLMAIMTCLKVKSLDPENGEVEKYDSATQKRIKTSVPLFKELMGKPIGLLLIMEEYAKMMDGQPTGDTAWKPTIVAPFTADGFTASEVLTKATSPATVEKMVDQLRDKPLKNKPAASADNGFSDPSQKAGADLESDIPW